MAQQKTSVAVADLLPLMAEGVRAVLGATDDLELTAVVSSLHEVRELLQRTAPAVLLVNKGSGQKAILDFLEEVKNNANAPAVVIWGLWMNEASAARFLLGGAMGVLSSSATPSDLAACLRSVATGVRYLHSAQFRELGPIRSVLTKREQQVLDCIARGVLRNRDIGGELGITPSTVKVHLKRIMEKTGVRSRYALAIAGLGRKPEGCGHVASGSR